MEEYKVIGNHNRAPKMSHMRPSHTRQACRPINPLLSASRNGDEEKVRSLLENGTDPNIQNDDSDTALIIATVGGYLNCIEVLLEYGADVNIKDCYGRTALNWAKNDDVRNLLEGLPGPKAAIKNTKTYEDKINHEPEENSHSVVPCVEKNLRIDIFEMFEPFVLMPMYRQLLPKIPYQYNRRALSYPRNKE